jgi:gamma-glutamyltranspeptidase / glutathione hydrolase
VPLKKESEGKMAPFKIAAIPKNRLSGLLFSAVVSVLLVACAAAPPQLSTLVNSPVNDSENPPAAELEDVTHVQAVVSAHQLASEAGMQVLEAGGSAADAAVAVAAVLSVVEPWFSSALGGGTWALYYDAERDEVTSLDGVGYAGSLATPSDYADRLDVEGIHHAILPGAWDGWMLWLSEYGQLELREVLEPAIEIARDGHPASPAMILWLQINNDMVIDDPTTAQIYAPNGLFIQEGDTVYQEDMARTFLELALAYDRAKEQGHVEAIQAARDYFYRGPIAEAIVAYSDENGGYLTREDFHDFEAEIAEPIFIEYSDEITVYQNPPNSQGITMLLALNILKDFEFLGTDPAHPDTVHVQVEAIKLAFADRYYHVGDPDEVQVPLSALLSEEHATAQRQRIEMDAVIEWPIEDILDTSTLNNTTTFHVVDRHGNAAAVTTSLGAQFVVIGETGIHINERMKFFSLEEDNPNLLEARKKVRHTSNPYMALRNGRPYILGGNTGVDTQPQAQAQQFLNIVEFGLSAQEAVAQPRFVTTAFPDTRLPSEVGNTLQVEADFSAETVTALRARGHDVVVGQGIFGSANVIVIQEDGLDAQVGAEPRESMSYGMVAPVDLEE